ncbi:MAG TPA: phosphotransferase [Anaerolineales bacterium]|nr:phosphotransferase [Anaerolineales bacterium]
MIDLADILKGVAAWRGQSIHAEPIAGGLTNRNFRAVVGGRGYFVSIPGERSEQLAIPRADEIYNTRAASETGVSPRVLYHLPESGAMIVEFVNGRTMTQADMHTAGMPERLASAVRRLHSARPFANDFDLFHLAASYRKILAERRLPPPDAFDGYQPLLAEVEASLRAHALPRRPCSNDLVPENLIDDGQKLWIVDFGYSGNNDPCSELGNAVCEADYNSEEAGRLCAAYFGESDSRLLARMQLYAVMSDVTWSLWSVIQEHLSDLDIDFRAYGGRRWARATDLLESHSLQEWMSQAKQ